MSILSTLLRGRRGVAALEFALVMPVLFLTFLACADVGRMLSWVEQARRSAIAAADAASANASLCNTTPCPAPSPGVSTAALTTIMGQVIGQSTSAVWSSDTVNNGMIATIIQADGNSNLVLISQVKYPATLSQSSMLGCKAGTAPNTAQMYNRSPLLQLFAGHSWPGDQIIVVEEFVTLQPFLLASGFLNKNMTNIHDFFVFRPRQPMTPQNPAGTC